ncbi:MAG: ComEC/Rec2 family competence protein [Clostridia bacterium]|nr:ComEC/Rec2 family competence protein [Clostridia bacterium]
MYKSQHIITLKNYLILFVIAFACGIYLAASLGLLFMFPILIILWVIFCVLLTLLIIKGKRNAVKVFLLPIMIIFCFVVGVFRFSFSKAVFDDKLVTFKDESIWTSGIVSSVPSETSSSHSYSMEFLVCQADHKPIDPETIILYIPKSRGEHIREGDKICCWTTLKSPDRETDFDNYDYFSHLRGKNISLIGTTHNANPDDFKSPEGLTYSIKELGTLIKNKVVFATDKLLYDSTKLAPILKGILVGDKSDFSDALYKKFSYAGLSHIVAVSGMHLSILFALLAFLLQKLPTSYKKSLLFSVPILFLFVAAANFTPSICRAGIMMLVMIISAFLNQRYSPINALFISLAIILWITPYSLFSKSLSLSFGATLGILVFWKYLMNLFDFEIKIPNFAPERIASFAGKALKFIVPSLATSFSAFLGTAYFSALFFQNVSWVQFITNLWVVPAVTAAFCLGFLAVLLFYISPYLATSIFYYPLRFLLGIIYKTADIFGKRKFSFYVPENSLNFATFVLYTGIVIFTYFLLKALYDIKKEKSGQKGRQKIKIS